MKEQSIDALSGGFDASLHEPWRMFEEIFKELELIIGVVSVGGIGLHYFF